MNLNLTKSSCNLNFRIGPLAGIAPATLRFRCRILNSNPFRLFFMHFRLKEPFSKKIQEQGFADHSNQTVQLRTEIKTPPGFIPILGYGIIN